MLTALLGLPYEEVAELTGCPVGTVRSRVNRARGVLIRKLADAEQADRAAVGCAA